MKIWWKLYNNTGQGGLVWEWQVKLLLHHLNQLALWANKKNHLEPWCNLVYKSSQLKNSLNMLSNTQPCIHAHKHDYNGFLRYFNEPSSVSVECQSTWGPTEREQKDWNIWFLPHQQICFYKTFFVREQVPSMQTSTVSGNKYTGKQRKVWGASDPHETGAFIYIIQKHSTV